MKKRLLILFSSLSVLACMLFFFFDTAKEPMQTQVVSFGTNGIEAISAESNTYIEETPSETVLVENWEDILPATTTVQETTPAFEEYDIRIMAIGDNLMHMGLVNSGRQADGTYNFDFLFADISDFIENSDLSIINQETPLAGNDLGFSGYPEFNSPTEVGDAIAKAGFDVVLSATNHSADQGISRMDNIVSFWEKYPQVTLAGLHAPITGDETKNPRIQLITVKEVTFAVLNYTYGPNYGSAPQSLFSRMDLLCNVDENSRVIDFTTLHPQVLADIEEAQQLADIVIVCPHWGSEYSLTPSSYQETFAMQMTQAGADLILGTHPHVPQPISVIEASNGNTALCYYSLGNYISTQQNGPSMLEQLAWVTFHVTEDEVTLDYEKSGALPLVFHYLSGPLRFGGVYPLEDYTEELACKHGIWNWGGIAFHLSDLQKWSEQIIGDRSLRKSDMLSHVN